MWLYKYDWSKNPRPLSTEDACKKAFAEDCDGQVETAAAQAETATNKLAELIGMLHENGHLTEDQVSKLLDGGYELV